MPGTEIKIDLAYKRFSKRQYTSLVKKWHEEYPGKALTIKLSDIWIDPIPTAPPTSNTEIVEVVDMLLTEDLTVDDHLSWLACSEQGNTSTQIGDFIQPDQDIPQQYYVRLFDSLGNQIYVGDDVGWEFDYANGVMTFENSPTNYSSPFSIKAYRYIGRLGSIDNLMATLDKAYDGPDGSGSGRVIHADFGPVEINATNGSAALQINPIDYIPAENLTDGQIINKNGILYIYDSSRNTWVSMQRQNVIFSAKRADGRYLNVSTFSSLMSGWPALRDGVICGVSAQASSGYGSKKFSILKNGVSEELHNFSMMNHYYANGDLNIPFNANDLVQILASSEYGSTNNAIINLEIAWRA